jgi:hypothetical protein
MAIASLQMLRRIDEHARAHVEAAHVEAANVGAQFDHVAHAILRPRSVDWGRPYRIVGVVREARAGAR